MTRLLLTLFVFLLSCSKEEPNGQPPLKKVDSQFATQPLMAFQVKPSVRGTGTPSQGAKISDQKIHLDGHPEFLSPHELPPSEVEAEGVEYPLRLKGLGSLEELRDALAAIGNVEEDVLHDFEKGFRLTFTVEKRDFEQAKKLLERVLKKKPNLAQAYRVLAFITLSENFNADGARALYEKALSLRSNYKEVHYALAVLFLLSDKEKGKTHFEKAIELGQEDYQNLAKFYRTPGGETPPK